MVSASDKCFQSHVWCLTTAPEDVNSSIMWIYCKPMCSLWKPPPTAPLRVGSRAYENQMFSQGQKKRRLNERKVSSTLTHSTASCLLSAVWLKIKNRNGIKFRSRWGLSWVLRVLFGTFTRSRFPSCAIMSPESPVEHSAACSPVSKSLISTLWSSPAESCLYRSASRTTVYVTLGGWVMRRRDSPLLLCNE